MASETIRELKTIYTSNVQQYSKDVQALIAKYQALGATVQSVSTKMTQFNAATGQMVTTQRTLSENAKTGNLMLKETTTTTDAATKKTNMFASSMKSSILRFAAYTIAIGGAIKAFQTLIAFTQDGIQQFRDFEKSMAEVSTILQDIGMDHLPNLTSGVETMAIQFGQSATDMANGLYEILSAAVPAEDAMRLLHTATKASIAGLTDVKTSVDILTSVINAYGLSVSQAARVSDYLFQTVVRGKLHFEDFASSLGYITPIAANAGIEFKEISAAMSTATRMGLHLDMTSRGLALAIQNIVDPTEGAKEAATKYGVSIGALAFRIHGLQGIMQQLHDASEKYGKHIIGEIVPNMRSLRVVSALAGDEGIAGLAEDMDLLTNSTGRTDEALAKMQNTSQMLADILEQQISYAARTVGEAWDEMAISIDRAKLAFITFFTGDMERQLELFDARMKNIKQSYYDMILSEATTTKPTVFEQLTTDAMKLAGKLKQGDMKSYITDIFAGIRGKGVSYFETIGKSMIFAKGSPIQNIVNDTIDFGDALTYAQTKSDQMDLAQQWLDLRKEIDLAEMAAEEAGDTVPQWGMYSIAAENIVDPIKEMKKTLSDLEIQMETNQTTLNMTQSDFDALEGVIHDFNYAINQAKTNLDQLEIAMDNLANEIGEIGNMYDGLLGEQLAQMEAEDELLDEIEAIERALQGSETAYNSLSDEVKQYIDDITAAKEKEDELALAMKQNNLEKLQIQLKGMMRRRGLTRMEEKQLKKIEIENTKLRIEQMQLQTDAMEDAFDEQTQTLEDYQQSLEWQLQDLKNTRDQDIADLRETIRQKEEELEDYRGYYQEQLDELEYLQGVYHATLLTMQGTLNATQLDMLDQHGIDIIAELESIRDEAEPLWEEILNGPNGGGGQPPPPPTYNIVDIREIIPNLLYQYFSSSGVMRTAGPNRWQMGEEISWQRGTHFLPHTGWFYGHRGEEVKPSGSDSSLGGIVVNQSFGNINISNEYDENHVAAIIRSATMKGIMDARTGQSRYRFR